MSSHRSLSAPYASLCLWTALVGLTAAPGCLGAAAVPDPGTSTSDSETTAETTTDQPSECGNGVKEAGEPCDDGNQTPGDGCENDCTLSTCGNGKKDAGEECDDGNEVDGDACKNDCTLLPAPDCGDGVVNEDKGEQCDDGADNGDTKACTADCQTNVCSDGKQGPEEECDDGADNADTKACTTMCKLNVCGDGLLLEGTELCDDGANNQDDLYGGCTTNCEPGPRCGDGVVNGDEACDDGNDDDEDLCSNTCVAAKVRYVFVTSGIYNGKMGGLIVADSFCTTAAGPNGVGSPDATWAAWISDSDTSAASRMDTTFTGWYVLPTNPPTLVAKGWAGLASATHLAPIDRTETGAPVEEPFEVWTNTTVTGDIRDPAAHCTNWTSSGAQQTSYYGFSNADDSTWTESTETYGCAASFHLYCIEN